MRSCRPSTGPRSAPRADARSAFPTRVRIRCAGVGVRPRLLEERTVGDRDHDTPRVFLHELGDILYVEQKLAEETLPKLIEEVQDSEFRDALDEHLMQTKKHVTNGRAGV